MINIRIVLSLVTVSCLSACSGEEPASNQWLFSCDDGFKFEISYNDDGSTALLESTEGKANLVVSRSGSGARYTDGTLVFWNKGTQAFIELNDKIVHSDCEGEKVSK